MVPFSVGAIEISYQDQMELSFEKNGFIARMIGDQIN
jgi:hypothetical protein